MSTEQLVAELARHQLGSRGIALADSTGSVVATITVGMGSPEGVQAARKGSLHLDLTNGALYVKETGVTATGWVESGSGGEGGGATTIVELTDVEPDALDEPGYVLHAGANGKLHGFPKKKQDVKVEAGVADEEEFAGPAGNAYVTGGAGDLGGHGGDVVVTGGAGPDEDRAGNVVLAGGTGGTGQDGGDIVIDGGISGSGGARGLILLRSVPTADPHVVGALYTASNVLKISTG